MYVVYIIIRTILNYFKMEKYVGITYCHSPKIIGTRYVARVVCYTGMDGHTEGLNGHRARHTWG